MNKLFNRLSRSPFGVRIAVLTTYLALVNSFALFVVYPALKSSGIVQAAASLALYGLFSVPFFVYFFKRSLSKPKASLVMIGLGLLLIASIGQCIVMHAATSVIIVHALFYLYAGLVEETLWRGTLWNIVSEKVGATWKVWGIVTAHFVVLHIPFALLDKPAPLFFIVQVVVLGSALGLLRILTKGVTGSVLLHAVVNMVVYT